MVGENKYIYFFEEGHAGMRNLLGGKGSNLAEMKRLGLPVPPGFTITTAACRDYFAAGRSFPPGLDRQLEEAMARLQAATGKVLGGGPAPLLVSVRSGAAVSMPGMMDTILDLGMNDSTVAALAQAAQDAWFAYDCYRRFIETFCSIVMRVPRDRFESVLDEYRRRRGARSDADLDGEALAEVVAAYRQVVTEATGREFPQDVLEQLRLAVRAVFDSWHNPRAVIYRDLHRVPHDLGTAVNIQAMVFGNMGSGSATGVVFTRDPATGARQLFGEYLVNAQGEDVVAGVRTPRKIANLRDEMPEVYGELAGVAARLEKHYRDVQDIEFTIERGKLYVLQTRAAKRTAEAAVKVVVDLVGEGVITREEALLRVEPGQLVQLLHRRIDPAARVQVIATGLPASPGAASGKAVFEADSAQRLHQAGEAVILVRPETTPDDIHGMIAARGILTTRGGMTSHAAVVARGLGKPCVCGCEEIRVSTGRKELYAGDLVVREGETISLDGATGRVMLGEVPVIDPDLGEEFWTLLRWADEVRSLAVRANADTPADAAKAREFGAEGIGLCRTEHMFFASDRLPVMQEMIMAQTEGERRAALDRLLPMQQNDFEGILRAMEGLPTTIRLLDPPLHEFLPRAEELAVEIAVRRERGCPDGELREKEAILHKVRALAEANPMLGLRGCRLGIMYPEIYEMQARAIFRAAARLRATGVEVFPEVMVPLVADEAEFRLVERSIRAVAREVREETGASFDYLVGTMIELPRACLVADRIAASAEFFSFGTNDLTQTTFGFSRDDAEGKFLPAYLSKRVLRENPFAVLDGEGVGKLISMGVELGRSQRPQLKVGICGEHGGDPASIEFCHRARLDYVSCSPFRVPVARLSAAQARLRELAQE